MGSIESGKELFEILGLEDGFGEMAKELVADVGLDPEQESENCKELVARIKETAAKLYADNLSDEEMGLVIEFHKSPAMVRAEELFATLRDKVVELFEHFGEELLCRTIAASLEGGVGEEPEDGSESGAT